MTKRCVLLVEGEGDRKAVPDLFRKVAHNLGVFDLLIEGNPIKTGDYKKLMHPGKLERYIGHACNRSGADCVLLLLDCDDHCAVEIARGFLERIRNFYPASQKRIGIGFFVKEFESLFLLSINSIAQSYPGRNWVLDDFDHSRNWEERRDAKGTLNNLFRNSIYKAFYDQAKFVSALDLDALRANSRSYRHFENLIKWLAGHHLPGEPLYPVNRRH